MTITKKHSPRHPGNRQQSKSCDLHRHSPLLLKKKYPIHQKQKRVADTISPIQHHHHDGRASPKLNSSSKYHGNMWIRPVAITSPTHLRSIASDIAPSPASKEQTDKDRGVKNTFTTATQMNDSTLSQSIIPILDDEIMLYTLLNFSSTDNPFDPCRSSRNPKSSRVAFGESGKPIKPAHAFIHHSLASTALTTYSCC